MVGSDYLVMRWYLDGRADVGRGTEMFVRRYGNRFGKIRLASPLKI